MLNYLLKINRNRIKGLENKLITFFNLPGNDEEFESLFNEIFGVYFIDTILKYKVLEIELNDKFILSPNRRNNQSCDILATDGKRNIYFESKKRLKKDTESKKITDWIRDQLDAANKKGAENRLIRIPFRTPSELKKKKKSNIGFPKFLVKMKIFQRIFFV